MEKLIPYVIDKTLKKNKFNPELIYKSLLKETSISENNARKVTEMTVRTLVAIGSLVPYLTAPMIREFVNVTLIKFGLIKERLYYTRIGFPKYDLNKIIKNNNELESNIIIVKHIKNENYNVEQLIKKNKQ